MPTEDDKELGRELANKYLEKHKRIKESSAERHGDQPSETPRNTKSGAADGLSDAENENSHAKTRRHIDMRKTIIIVTVIAAIATVACVYVWCSMHRYYAVHRGGSTAYLLDRMTGDIWLVTPSSKRRICEAAPQMTLYEMARTPAPYSTDALAPTTPVVPPKRPTLSELAKQIRKQGEAQQHK